MLENFEKCRIAVNGIELNVAQAGVGPAVVLLHGYPQTHVMWHAIAPSLARDYHVILPDLRGYGDSDKPQPAPEDHVVYTKRTMAADIAALMDTLGIASAHIVGHDRGARVGHRLALDHPEKVVSYTSLDVVATQAIFDGMDAALGRGLFHWLLMRQPHPIPETIIGNSVETYFDYLMEFWCNTPGAIAPQAMAEYRRCFCNQESVNATVAEYRAVELDLKHDEADRGPKITCPMMVLWGGDASKRPGWPAGRGGDVLHTWHDRATDVRGRTLDCGHFLAEERPDEVLTELRAFLAEIS
ncbi:MAG: alpha/beta hydrolase [Pseudomonadota bacterium]